MINNCDEEKLHKQKQVLKEAITLYDNENFVIFNNEAGTGKTVTTLEILQDLKGMKCLFVTLRNADGIEYSKKLNKVKGKNYSIAVNTDTMNKKQFNDIKKDLYKYTVIFVSHEKYKVLSIDKKQREYFSNNRQILIIDEFVDMVKGSELSLNVNYIKDFENNLQERAYRNLYVDIISEIEDYLKSDKKLQTFFNTKQEYKKVLKKINKLKTIIKQDKEIKFNISKTKIIKAIDDLRHFYNQTCIVEGNTIYCTNRDIGYWKLTNNIILDASGKLNPYEGLGFQIINQSKILDHKQWTFNIIKTNTSKSAKQRAINFYNEINSKVNDDTLVVGNISDEEHINAKHKNHFGNLTGSNQYRNLKNCIICHNPNMPYRQYALEYIYYYNKRFDNRNSWSGSNSGSGDEKVFRFNEKKFEEYRQKRNVNEIYQATKRVNRQMNHDSIITIYNNDMEQMDLLLKMFKGDYKMNVLDNTIEFEKTERKEYDNTNRKNNSNANKFITLCGEIIKLKHLDLQQQKKNRKGEFEIVKGKYKKSAIADYLKIDKKNLSKLFNDKDVIDYITRHKIIISGQTLDFTQYI